VKLFVEKDTQENKNNICVIQISTQGRLNDKLAPYNPTINSQSTSNFCPSTSTLLQAFQMQST